MSDHDLDAWPEMLRTLATVIGPDRTLELAHACGGLDRVYVPKEPTASHEWARVLTSEEWTAVTRLLGGQRIRLPRGFYVNLRKRQILSLAETGLSHHQIALRAQVTERYVRMVLEGLRVGPAEDPRQTRLFE